MAGRALLLRAEPGFSLPAFERFAPPPPPALVAARIEAASQPGDIVLDLFGRGGWVARAAIDRQRKGISLEGTAARPAARRDRPPAARPPPPRRRGPGAGGVRAPGVQPQDVDHRPLREPLRDLRAAGHAGRDHLGRPSPRARTAGRIGPQPTRKHYRCPVCRDQLGGGEQRQAPLDANDLRLALDRDGRRRPGVPARPVPGPRGRRVAGRRAARPPHAAPARRRSPRSSSAIEGDLRAALDRGRAPARRSSTPSGPASRLATSPGARRAAADRRRPRPAAPAAPSGASATRGSRSRTACGWSAGSSSASRAAPGARSRRGSATTCGASSRASATAMLKQGTSGGARRAPAGDGAPRGAPGSGRGSGWSSARRRCGRSRSGSPGPTTRRRGCSAARPPRRSRSSRCSGPRSARRGAGRRRRSPGRCAASSRSWPATRRVVFLLEGDGPGVARRLRRSAASAPTTASPARGCPRPGRETGGVVELVPPGSGAVPGGAADPRERRAAAGPGRRRRPGHRARRAPVRAARSAIVDAAVLRAGRGAGRGRRRGRRAQAARRAGELRRAPGRDPRRPRPGGAPPAPRPAARAARGRRADANGNAAAARAPAGARRRPRRAPAGHRPRRPRRSRRPAARAGGRGPLVARRARGP